MAANDKRTKIPKFGSLNDAKHSDYAITQQTVAIFYSGSKIMVLLVKLNESMDSTNSQMLQGQNVIANNPVMSEEMPMPNIMVMRFQWQKSNVIRTTPGFSDSRELQ